MLFSITQQFDNFAILLQIHVTTPKELEVPPKPCAHQPMWEEIEWQLFAAQRVSQESISS